MEISKETLKRLKETRDYSELLEAVVEEAETVFNPKEARTEEAKKQLEEYKIRFEQALSLKDARFFFCPNSEPLAFLGVYARIIKEDKNSPQAHYYMGKVLMNKNLFLQAYLLFDRGLRLDTPDSSEDIFEFNLHRKFHLDLSNLGFLIQRKYPGSRLSRYSYPVEELGFKFSKKRGFYLPGFRYNIPNMDFEILRLGKGKERALCNIHYNLAMLEKVDGEEHRRRNCPYLEYLSHLI